MLRIFDVALDDSWGPPFFRLNSPNTIALSEPTLAIYLL